MNNTSVNKYLFPLCDGGITKQYQGPSPSHWGVDFGWVSDTYCHLYAIGDGTVVDNFYSSSCGYSIVIQVGKRFATYIHMNKASELAIGSKVLQGQLVGYRGNSGESNGPHLHFGLTSETDKGYSWELVKALAINPMPYLYKSHNYNYVGSMFDSIGFLDDEETDQRIANLEKLVAEYQQTIKEYTERLAKIRELT